MRGMFISSSALCVTACIVTIISDLTEPFRFLTAFYLLLMSSFIALLDLESALTGVPMVGWLFLPLAWARRAGEAWIKLLARVWGRASLLLFLGSVFIAQGGFVRDVLGIMVVVIGCVALSLSRVTARKLSLLSEMFGGGTEASEGRAVETFRRFCRPHDKCLTAAELQALVDSQNVFFFASVISLALEYINVSRTGAVSEEEWIAWATHAPAFFI